MTESMRCVPLRVGVVGLGWGFTLMLPTFLNDPRIRLVGAVDQRPSARERFVSDFGAPTYDSVEAMCAAPEVEVVYVATPHQLHADHVCIAAAAGKHVLVEKPMAISLRDCTRMIEAAQSASVYLVVGPSHSFDRPIQRVFEIIRSGRYGGVRMITALNFTDFLYRPRRPEELRTQDGGGVVHSQAAHQMDIVRMLGGGIVRSVHARTGSWDSLRPTEGAYSALLSFENGAFCSAVYSGYGRYDTDVLMDGISETGQRKSVDGYGHSRRMLRSSESEKKEASLKTLGSYGGKLWVPEPAAERSTIAHEHFGHIVVCCEKADLRPTATNIEIFDDNQLRIEPLPPPTIPRKEVIDELYSAIREDIPPLHSGEWARATTEVCLAVLQSEKTQSERLLHYQVAVS